MSPIPSLPVHHLSRTSRAHQWPLGAGVTGTVTLTCTAVHGLIERARCPRPRRSRPRRRRRAQRHRQATASSLTVSVSTKAAGHEQRAVPPAVTVIGVMRRDARRRDHGGRQSASCWRGTEVRATRALPPAASTEPRDGVVVRTATTPAGELLCRLRDGRRRSSRRGECGRRWTTTRSGRSSAAAPGEEPYPRRWTAPRWPGVAKELAPQAVFVKGDLADDGADEQFARSRGRAQERVGERLHVVRGGATTPPRASSATTATHRVDLPGVTITLLDAAIPTETTGTIHRADRFTGAARRVGGPAGRDGPPPAMGGWRARRRLFGLHPDAGDALAEVHRARRAGIVAYTADTRVRHHVRPMACGVPTSRSAA